jgi:hypothetical protein
MIEAPCSPLISVYQRLAPPRRLNDHDALAHAQRSGGAPARLEASSSRRRLAGWLAGRSRDPMAECAASLTLSVLCVLAASGQAPAAGLWRWAGRATAVR